MKFARYLQETQTAEWKKAYIDYRGLKKRITAIRKSQENSVLRPGSRPDLTESPRQSVEDHSDSSDDHGIVSQRVAQRSLTSARSARPTSPAIEKERTAAQSNSEVTQTNVVGSSKSQKAPSSREQTGPKKRRRRPTFSRGASLFPLPFAAPPTLQETRSLLSSVERSFLDALDGELDKIETFYLDREKEMTARAQLLHEQLHELTYHRRLFHEAQERSVRVEKFLGIRKTSKLPIKKRKAKSQKDQDDEAKFGYLDPEEYQNAKKKLKKAVVEHYRGLEALHNYRILNMTGFRKALKKFEKVTKIPLLNAYMTEKVEISPFASESNVRNMMNEMETIFANQFSRGDKKRALLRLRAGLLHKSHHFSSFRSGLFFGLSLPPLVAGVYQSFQTDTRAAIPGWDGLLFVYSVLLVPVVFALLVGTNLLVWSRARVNYVFIFELEYRTRLDHREYFELPSILFCTLCYAFWLSFIRAGAPTMDPTYWPLVWLGFTAIIILDPFPPLCKHSRYWLVSRTGRLLLPGFHRVEFTDFWMGDQFCSLVFSLSNLSLSVCAYATGFNEDWRRCGSTSKLWTVAFVLAQLPLLIRLIQSIRRYRDSGLLTHLINGGKYGSGIISYLFYFLWRHQGGGGHGSVFALWCLFNTAYSVYASSWDLLMDWSLLQSHAKHVLLRNELLYSNYIPLYYCAIVANVLVRFIWVIYIPKQGPDFYLRSFIAGLLEVGRRTLWNFYRLENEHLGNVDQYRVTREVPLPYSLDDIGHDIDDDDDTQD